MSVKHIEGVEKVINNIEVLPPSNRGRTHSARSLSRHLQLRSAVQVRKHGGTPHSHHREERPGYARRSRRFRSPIRTMPGMRANQVPGTFAVTNNLRVLNPSGNCKKKKKAACPPLASKSPRLLPRATRSPHAHPAELSVRVPPQDRQAALELLAFPPDCRRPRALSPVFPRPAADLARYQSTRETRSARDCRC